MIIKFYWQKYCHLYQRNLNIMKINQLVLKSNRWISVWISQLLCQSRALEWFFNHAKTVKSLPRSTHQRREVKKNSCLFQIGTGKQMKLWRGLSPKEGQKERAALVPTISLKQPVKKMKWNMTNEHSNWKLHEAYIHALALKRDMKNARTRTYMFLKNRA